MTVDYYELLSRLYRGNTVPYERSIGAHPSFSRLREVLTNNDIFKIDPIAPYPISDNAHDASGYNARPQTEDRIYDGVVATANHRILVIIGPEGCGKSTALHFTLGRKFPKQDPEHFDRSAFALFDIKDWLSPQSPELLLEHVISQIRIKLQTPPFIFLTEKFNAFRQTPKLEALQPISINLTRDALEGFLAYLSLGGADESQAQRVALIFDNIDTVGKAQQLSLFRAIQTLTTSIESYRSFIARASGCRNIDNLQFILSMRPETAKALFSNATGHTSWPPSDRLHKADLTEQKDLNPWHLALSRIESMNLLDTPEGHQMRMALRIGIAKKLEEAIPDPKAYVQGLITWINKNYPEAARELKRFCGKSIRRRMMFALKIIGHPHIRLAYYDERMREMRGRITKDILYDAMYDFMQPLGEGQMFDHRAFLLNPYFVLEYRSSLTRAPLIGIHLLYFLDAHRSSDNLSRGEIFQRLLSIGYPKSMVDEALNSLCFSGLLRPVFAESPEIPSSYDVDTDLLGKYTELITAARPRETYFFVANAIRQVLELNSYTPAEHHLEKCHLVLVFLKELKEANARLLRLMLDQHSGNRQAVIDLRVSNYSKTVGVSLYDFTGNILDNFGKSVSDGNVVLSRDMREKCEAANKLRASLRAYYHGPQPIFVGGSEF